VVLHIRRQGTELPERPVEDVEAIGNLLCMRRSIRTLRLFPKFVEARV
jgi:hypothetical protein